MKKYALIALVLAVPAVALAQATFRPNARDKGTKRVATKTPAEAIAANDGRLGWCILADTDNVDNINFTLGNTATATVGIELQPGSSFCDPIGMNAVYTGTVYVAAQTTAATVNYYTLSY